MSKNKQSSVKKELRADHLGIDPTVQRTVDPKRVNKIASTLNFDALGTIIVSERDDGTYHVVDGQTRVAAVKEAGHGDYAMDCRVFTGLEMAEEAALFRLYNDTKQVAAVTKFRIRVIEGDPKAVSLNRMLEDYGWKVTGASGTGYFVAVAALEWVHDGGGHFEPGNLDACDVVINVLTTAFGRNSDGVRESLVKGLGLVVMRYGDQLDLRKLSVQLGSHDGGPIGLLGDARQLRRIRSGPTHDAMAEVLVNLVNKGRRTKRLPDWRS